MVPVVILNPSPRRKSKKMKHKSRRRRRSHHKTSRRRVHHRRNPSIPWKGILLAALGGGALGAGRYALEMTTLSPLYLGGISAAAGLAAGAAVSMASPMAGAGVAGAGMGIGVRDVLAATVALPASSNTADKTKSMSRVIDSQQMERIVDAKVRQLMEARRGYTGTGGAQHSYAPGRRA